MLSKGFPRPFGRYVLTAPLGEDALGRVYRALPASGEPGFFRLRTLESPELSSDALLDTIEQNGETHGFLKNIAIVRGVDMDAVEGVPYVAWLEENGRTLDALIEACRRTATETPVEHALLICEKVAAALDHAYNTMIDGDRTLHGLVWPGFVSISDDGETRLAGFGLAPGVLPSLHRAGLARSIAPYIAPEEREKELVAKNSDVYSVGVILLELLTGAPPPPDPLASLHEPARARALTPELLHVLRTALAPADGRYGSAGDLRREIGRLLFSGSYSPSTFNLAYFLNDMFRAEIEEEIRSRAREVAFARAPSAPASRTEESLPPAGPPPVGAQPVPAAPPAAPSFSASASGPTPGSRSVLFMAGGILAAAAVAGGIFLANRKAPPPAAAAVAPTALPSPVVQPGPLPELAATPVPATEEMNEAQFREEVSRRLALEVQKLEADIRARTPTLVPTVRLPVAAAPLPVAIAPVPAPTQAPTPAPLEARASIPIAAPSPTRPIVREGALVALDQVDSQPRILKIVKPPYPPLALQARIGGVVLLRVLVSENGEPARIEVLREARGGLTQAAVEAVRSWTFEPATKDGVAVRTWMTVPIPFEP
jgi:TonB family protein